MGLLGLVWLCFRGAGPPRFPFCSRAILSLSCPAVLARRHPMLLHAQLALVAGWVVVRLVMLWLSVRDGM